MVLWSKFVPYFVFKGENCGFKVEICRNLRFLRSTFVQYLVFRVKIIVFKVEICRNFDFLRSILWT